MTEQDLKKAGLSSTQPRRLILELLQRHPDRHLSAEDVYRLLLESESSVGVATIYRVLGQFESAGLVTRHQFDGNSAVYELNQGKHHDHLICTECGAIREFVDEEIEALQRKVAERLGFTIESHLLYIFGKCDHPDCNKK